MSIVNHRGFSCIPPSIHTIKLDASLKSELTWKVTSDASPILWELDFGIYSLSPVFLASYELAVRTFVEKVWKTHQDKTLGVILYRGSLPPFELELFAEYLHYLAACLPDEVPSFALFDCQGDPLLFSKEIFPHIYLGFRSGPIGALRWEENALKPLYYDARLGVALPSREKGLRFKEVEECLAKLDQEEVKYRLISEPYITQEWDDLDELIYFKDLISPMGYRMVQGFEAAGGKVIGAEGFEPPTFCSQSRRASQTALCPDK